MSMFIAQHLRDEIKLGVDFFSREVDFKLNGQLWNIYASNIIQTTLYMLHLHIWEYINMNMCE